MSSDNKVIVRVEVVIEEAGESARVTSIERSGQAALSHGGLIPLVISNPSPGSNVPVTVNGCIACNGQSPFKNSAYATTVYAKVYPNPNANPPATPPADALSGTPGATGSWSFNTVPLASTQGNSPNSTLAVWYLFADGTYQMEKVVFHGYMLGPFECGNLPPFGASATLHATFTGALAKWGTVCLTWNGVTWAGESTGGGCLLVLACHGEVFQLMSAGPDTSFLAAKPVQSRRPFTWSADGKALGKLAGPFAVTIVE